MSRRSAHHRTRSPRSLVVRARSAIVNLMVPEPRSPAPGGRRQERDLQGRARCGCRRLRGEADGSFGSVDTSLTVRTTRSGRRGRRVGIENNFIG